MGIFQEKLVSFVTEGNIRLALGAEEGAHTKEGSPKVSDHPRRPPESKYSSCCFTPTLQVSGKMVVMDRPNWYLQPKLVDTFLSHQTVHAKI